MPVSFSIKLQGSACNFIKTETLAQVLSCEFCKISKNNFFIEHLRAAAFGQGWESSHNQPPRFKCFSYRDIL